MSCQAGDNVQNSFFTLVDGDFTTCKLSEQNVNKLSQSAHWVPMVKNNELVRERKTFANKLDNEWKLNFGEAMKTLVR